MNLKTRIKSYVKSFIDIPTQVSSLSQKRAAGYRMILNTPQPAEFLKLLTAPAHSTCSTVLF